MPEIWFVRHGETDWNVQRRIQGWSDVPLNEHGKTQAALLAQCLTGIPFETVYASDLQRAMVTAETLGSAVNEQVHPSALLRERGFGRGEGLLQHEAKRRFPDGYAGREPMEDIMRRAEAFLDLASHRHMKRVLAVSHGGFIRVALELAGATKVPALQNTSISRMKMIGGNWKVLSLNSFSHLMPLQSEVRFFPQREIGSIPAKEYRPDRQIG